MAEESSQQFTSTGTASARNVAPTKASSARPVNRQPIKHVSSNTQSSQKYVYAGIGEQPLTQREFDENLKNLRNILSEVDGLLHGDMRNPENIKHCQQLLGFATSLRLPQEVKDKEIRSYPPVVQQLYQSVKNEGSSASNASQLAMANQTAITMAQVINSDLRHEAILKDLQTMDIDLVYDKYYGAQHEQDMIAMQESHQKFMDLLDMPMDTPEQRAEFERKAAEQLEEDRKRCEQELERKKREWEEIQRIKQRNPEKGAELERRFIKDNQEVIAILEQHNQELQEELDRLSPNDPRREVIETQIQGNSTYRNSLIDNMTRGGNTQDASLTPTNTNAEDKIKNLSPQTEIYQLPKLVDPEKGAELERRFIKDRQEEIATLEQHNQELQEELDRLSPNDPRRKAIEEQIRENGTQSNMLNGHADLNSERIVEVQKVVADTPTTHLDVAMTTQPKNPNGVWVRQPLKCPTNAPSAKMAQSPSDQALTSMGSDRGMGDLNLGITPGGKVGSMPTMPRRRSSGFNRNAIASTNRGFDLGTVGLVSTTKPKVPQTPIKDGLEKGIASADKISNTDNATGTNSADNRTPEQRVTSLGVKKENPLGTPVNLEEISDMTLLTVRSQQSQATV